MEYKEKLNEKYMPVLHCVSSRKGTSCKKFFFFFMFYMSFYISRYNFLQLFLTSFNIVGKKILSQIFPFLTDSLKLPHPLNGQNLRNVTKIFSQYSLTFSKADFASVQISHQKKND